MRIGLKNGNQDLTTLSAFKTKMVVSDSNTFKYILCFKSIECNMIRKDKPDPKTQILKS